MESARGILAVVLLKIQEDSEESARGFLALSFSKKLEIFNLIHGFGFQFYFSVISSISTFLISLAFSIIQLLFHHFPSFCLSFITSHQIAFINSTSLSSTGQLSFTFIISSTLLQLLHLCCASSLKALGICKAFNYKLSGLNLYIKESLSF